MCGFRAVVNATANGTLQSTIVYDTQPYVPGLGDVRSLCIVLGPGEMRARDAKTARVSKICRIWDYNHSSVVS